MFLINPFWYKAPLPSGLGYRYGYEFDGVDEYVSSSSSLNLTTDDAFSFSYWFKRPIATSFSEHIIGEVSSSSNSCMLMSGNSAYPLILIIADDGSRVDARGTVSYNGFNEWTHVLWTKNTGQDWTDLKLYVNGSLETTQLFFKNNLNSGQNITCDNFFIGGHSVGLGSPDYFTGRLDDVQFYDFELNATQASDIYNNGYVTAPTAAPIHHWKLGEADTFSTNWTVKDSVGTLDGTSVNMEEVDRKLGVAYSLDFDGVDEYVDFGEVNNQDGSSAFSISCWVKTNTTSGFHSIVSKLSGLSPFNGYEVQQNSNKIRFFIIDQNSNRLQANSINTLSLNTWYNIIFTYDGSKDISGCNLYINNSLETLTNTTNTFTGSADSTGIDFDIGSGQGSSYHWNGNIMEVSLYDTELSASDVALLFNETGTGNGVPIDPRNVGLSPTFYCPMVGPNDSFSTNWTITDEISGNNGTSVNMELADKTSETI